MTQTDLTRPQGINRIDPVLRDAASELGIVEFRAETLAAEREHANRLAAERAAVVDTDGVAVDSRSISGPGGQQLNLRFYRGGIKGAAGAPLLLYAHGGGFVTGNLDSDHAQCVELAREGGCLVVSVDYRLAPEHKFPAATEDAYAAVSWLAQHGGELDIDGSRLAVGGDSAGGNLAAVVALMARDRGGPKLLHQLLMYPVLGGPSDNQPSYKENAEGYGLTPGAMQWFLDHYTRTPADLDNPYVCPVRADDLSGLPPATILTAEYDVLRDEGEEYGRRLAEAGVPCTVSRYDGEPHGFMSMVGAVARASDAFEECSAALNAALLGTTGQIE